jgi:hypothetical protein
VEEEDYYDEEEEEEYEDEDEESLEAKKNQTKQQKKPEKPNNEPPSPIKQLTNDLDQIPEKMLDEISDGDYLLESLRDFRPPTAE